MSNPAPPNSTQVSTDGQQAGQATAEYVLAAAVLGLTAMVAVKVGEGALRDLAKRCLLALNLS